MKYSACGADVTDVMVDGEWLMQNRVVKTLDAEQVRQEAQQASRQLLG